MNWTLVALLITSAALAQSTQRSNPAQLAAQNDFHARQSALRLQGSESLSRERSRSKQELCVEAEKGGQAEIGKCLTKQFQATQQNYLAYVRAIRALLQLAPPGEPASAIHGKLPFDSAEDAWLKYRDSSCASMATQWEGGDQSGVAFADCRLKLTWNHMNELADLYSDLWH